MASSDAGALPESVDVAVVGGGITGLALAHRLAKESPDTRVAVLEADSRVGGKVRSERVSGCVCEWGPNGVLTSVPDTWQLAHELGLGSRLRTAAPAAKHRFLFRDGSLIPVPTSPGAFLSTDLLSLRGRLRVLAEPFIRGRSGAGDHSVFEFVERRLGREAAELFADALVTGIFAGDASALSMQSVFPRVAELERDHGSLARGLIAGRRKPAPEADAVGGAHPMPPRRALVSFDDGMQVLVDGLRTAIPDRLFPGVAVESLERDDSGWRLGVQYDAGTRTLRAGRVVLTVPAAVAADLTETHSEPLARELRAIPYVGVTVVGLIYRREQVRHHLNGFGFLVPRGSEPRLLGCIWSGSIFPDHTRDDLVMLRTMLGGARDPEAAMLSESHSVDLARTDLDRILGLDGSPVDACVYRHPRAIPQYTLGHQDRLNVIDRELYSLPGLHLAGNAYRGVGVNDCVRDAERLARRLASAVPTEVPV